MLLRLALITAVSLSADAAFAQAPPTRATIESVAPDGPSLTMRTRAGEQSTVRLDGKATVTLIVAAALSDVKQGACIGVAARRRGWRTEGDGGPRLPRGAALRGTGEGFRPFDLARSGRLWKRRKVSGAG